MAAQEAADIRTCRCPRATADEWMVDVADDALMGVNLNEDQSRGFTVGDGGICATGKGHRID